MIYEVLESICAELNHFLKYQLGQTEDVLVFSNIVDMNGAKALQQENVLHFSLLKIEEERTLNKTGGFRGNPHALNPSIYNAHVLIAATHSGKQYPDGVNLITRVLEFFVENPTLDSSNLSNLPSEVDRLTIEYNNYDAREVSNIWGAVGTKLMPYLSYKIGFIPVFKSKSLGGEAPKITGFDRNYEQR